MDFVDFLARLLLLPILFSVCVWGVWQYFAKPTKKTCRLRFLRCGGQPNARHICGCYRFTGIRNEFRPQRGTRPLQGA